MPSITKLRHRPWVIWLALIGLLLIWAPSAHAEGDLTWSLAPVDNTHGTGRPNFSYVLEPGTELTDAVSIRNQSTTALTLQVYAADGFTTTSGDLDLLPAGQASVDLGAWVTPAVTEVKLAPGESEEVSFTVAVPADANPGDHPGGIVTSHTTAEGTVQVDQRFGLRIHARVPGELTVAADVADVWTHADRAWNPFGTTDVQVNYDLTNTGNARTFFTYQADLSGPLGLGATSVNGELTEVLPGSTLQPQLELPGMLPLFFLSGDLLLTPQAVDGQVGQVIVVPLQTWTFPWGGMGVVLLIVVIAVTIGVIRARQSWEWETGEGDEAPAEEGPDITTSKRDIHDHLDPAAVGPAERNHS